MFSSFRAWEDCIFHTWWIQFVNQLIIWIHTSMVSKLKSVFTCCSQPTCGVWTPNLSFIEGTEAQKTQEFCQIKHIFKGDQGFWSTYLQLQTSTLLSWSWKITWQPAWVYSSGPFVWKFGPKERARVSTSELSSHLLYSRVCLRPLLEPMDLLRRIGRSSNILKS